MINLNISGIRRDTSTSESVHIGLSLGGEGRQVLEGGAPAGAEVCDVDRTEQEAAGCTSCRGSLRKMKKVLSAF